MRRFFRRDEGANSIEFAFLLPIWLWMTFEVIQIGMYFFYSASLFRATDLAVRQILVGGVANAQLSAPQFRAQVLCPQLPSWMSCNNVVTQIQTVPNSVGAFYALTNASGTTPPSELASVPMDNAKTSYCIGGPGSVVAVQVFYAMPVLGLPTLGLSQSTTFQGQNVVFISATAAFKNEPFSTSYAGC